MTRISMFHWECDGDGCMVWEDTMGNARRGVADIQSKYWSVRGKKHYCPQCTIDRFRREIKAAEDAFHAGKGKLDAGEVDSYARQRLEWIDKVLKSDAVARRSI